MPAFTTLGVPADLTAVLADRGITEPTPIQAKTLPDSLAGRDVLGRGRTGSGKTYAFLLPLVARLAASGRPATARKPRALVLAPTRELVGQIEEALKPLADAAGLTTMTVFGGVGQNPQVRSLRSGVDILLACPGRLEDLIGQGHCDLGAVEVTVLDEADHMADLGFLPAVRRLLDATPSRGQRLLFSATLDKAIDVLVKRFLHEPVVHQADSAQSPVSAMDHHVLHLNREHRLPVLVDLASAPGRTVVFTRTKHGAKALTRQLNKSGVPTVELHGNLSQNARTRNMEAFHTGKASTLVATDIAARGIHVDDVTLVVHADPPAEHKAYLHRSGRTARAGAAGTVVTLMTDEQVRDVRDLTRAAGIKPTITRMATATDPVLVSLAPGERSTIPGGLVVEAPAPTAGARSGGGSARSGSGSGAPRRSSRGGRGRSGGPGGQGGQSSTGGQAKAGGSKPAGSGQGRGRRTGGASSGGAAAGGSRHTAASFSTGRR
ncbi:DEAD/DEAH box helicase [Nocardioides sp. zg-579]|uniref:DEAD/DEAH box helicase n=1 Tax=Nocardioides marmotae TaxID=2663857 RepID=A0A6I3JH55_9ACTN|nr:DEAD/DEAH box helicase [Nocardioides marmotae]MCR6033829.1 DEAD/DEAH box helicase [Gordonia jinghuaiqii]MTB97487.1 DEAD/DEAH box helicase [Nocardioides marmotae]QKE03133.1 DEAD/DEAH box helicase [Nocardioides marmotae]